MLRSRTLPPFLLAARSKQLRVSLETSLVLAVLPCRILLLRSHLCFLSKVEASLEGFEPPTFSLGPSCSIRAELQGQISRYLTTRSKLRSTARKNAESIYRTPFRNILSMYASTRSSYCQFLKFIVLRNETKNSFFAAKNRANLRR